MKITNRYGLPGAFVEAVKNDPYDAGDCDISTTGLLLPPMIAHLRRGNGGNITEDVVDRWWALLGQSVHAILERAEPSAIVEQRLYMTVGETVLSGQFDRISLSQKTLQDYKICSVWQVIFGMKPDHEAQLNILAELAISNGHPTEYLEIVACLRDWQKSKAKHDKGYPRQPIVRIKVPIWPQERRIAFIEGRIALHNEVPPQPCTDEERWYSGSKWAVMKKGRKSALRLLDSEHEAWNWCALNEHTFLDELPDSPMQLNKGIYIEHRPGEYRRCEDYCNVRPFCPVYN